MTNLYAGSCRAVTHIKAPLFHFTPRFCRGNRINASPSAAASQHSSTLPASTHSFYSPLTTALMTSQISGETEAGATVRKYPPPPCSPTFLHICLADMFQTIKLRENQSDALFKR